MNDILSALSTQVAHAAEQAAASVVQVLARRRPVAGVAFAEDLVLTSARHLDDDAVVVRRGDGHTLEGTVLGASAVTGLAVVRVPGLGVPPARPAPEPRVGHLAVSVGRTWSGGTFASLTSIAVIGGPLRTGRATELARVYRTATAPHGAFTGGALADADGRVLGILTAAAIRGTTVVVPIDVAIAAAQDVVAHGGARQGFLGVSTVPVMVPARQRPGREEPVGLLITGIVEEGPADAAGLLVGDIIAGFDGRPVQEPEQLVTRLRGDHVGKTVPLTVLRGASALDVPVTIGERRRERAGR
ncbi:MAG: PDZ domain-containing protein [Acidobacteria bacterium]|nr:PDZ domain-containing protein [Acidobacteriota bacterium]